MAKYLNNRWVVQNQTQEPCKYRVGDTLVLYQQEVRIVAIETCHSITGPAGCLLRRDEELPDEWFHFLGYNLYFDREIDWFLGDKASHIMDRQIKPGDESKTVKEEDHTLMALAGKIIDSLK